MSRYREVLFRCVKYFSGTTVPPLSNKKYFTEVPWYFSVLHGDPVVLLVLHDTWTKVLSKQLPDHLVPFPSSSS